MSLFNCYIVSLQLLHCLSSTVTLSPQLLHCLSSTVTMSLFNCYIVSSTVTSLQLLHCLSSTVTGLGVSNWTLTYKCTNNGDEISLGLSIQSWTAVSVIGWLRLSDNSQQPINITATSGDTYTAQTTTANPQISFDMSVSNGKLTGRISVGSQCTNRRYTSTKLSGEYQYTSTKLWGEYQYTSTKL